MCDYPVCERCGGFLHLCEDSIYYCGDCAEADYQQRKQAAEQGATSDRLPVAKNKGDLDKRGR